MRQSNVDDFLLQALETETGGVRVYEAAIRCAHDAGMRKQWTNHRSESEQHARIYAQLVEKLGLDSSSKNPGRAIVQQANDALVALIESARQTTDADTAQIVAAECVAHVETKCNVNWELVGDLGKKTRTDYASALRKAYEQVVEQKNAHLYHARGWVRDLWIRRLGLTANPSSAREQQDAKPADSPQRERDLRSDLQ